MNPLIQKNKKAIMIGGIVAACGLLAGVRWLMTRSSQSYAVQAAKQAQDNANESNVIPAVKSFVCKKTKFIDNLVMTGTLQGGSRVELRFNRDGNIGKINYQVGDRIRKGARIAELDMSEAKIKLQQAESELSQSVELYRAGAIAKPRLTQSQLAAQLAREEFNRSFITAPMEGSLSEINTAVGEYVNSQMTVATLVSAGAVYVEVGVIEKDLGKLHLGQTVNVEVQTYPGVVFNGKITSISPVVEGTSRTRTVKAEIPNDKGILLPGMFARASIFIMEKPDTMVVPATAIQENKEGARVYLLAGDKCQATPVTIGYESVDYVEILSGLKEGEKVVAQVSDRIRDGIKVEVVEEIAYEPH